jgi:hypothetical protein
VLPNSVVLLTVSFTYWFGSLCTAVSGNKSYFIAFLVLSQVVMSLFRHVGR